MLNVNWLALPNYFLRSILHSSLVGGEGTTENRVEAGGRTNKKKESQYMLPAYTTLTICHA